MSVSSYSTISSKDVQISFNSGDSGDDKSVFADDFEWSFENVGLKIFFLKYKMNSEIIGIQK